MKKYLYILFLLSFCFAGCGDEEEIMSGGGNGNSADFSYEVYNSYSSDISQLVYTIRPYKDNFEVYNSYSSDISQLVYTIRPYKDNFEVYNSYSS
ncbi:hypothetical protein, partial [Dysgonomonas hofstadii]|uniref:hypothetical protein n=1 Tax=Dysgonomonas hofstadii TaxID=637886 RepID=UPI001C84694E